MNNIGPSMQAAAWLLVLAWLWTPLASVADDNAPPRLDQVVVTAPQQDQASDFAVPALVLSDEELRLKLGHSIGETLKQELGITSQSFGPGVGAPVIRGQSGPRVRVLSNGIGSNDVSAFSPDHASSVEPLLAERIEVLRGPSTLLYGSGAIGGIVNVIDNRIPGALPDKPLGGAVEQRYDTASSESSTAFKADGGTGHVAAHLDGFYRDRDNLHIGGSPIDVNAAQATDARLEVIDNPHGLIRNSGAHTISGSAGVSLVGDPGFAGVSINRLENNYGIAPDGSGAEITRIDLKQSKYDFKSELKQPLAYVQTLRTKLGYTDYQHTEIANGAPGAFFSNKSYEGRVELTHEPLGPLHGTLGFQAVSSDFSAIDKSTGSAIVPRSQIHNYGVFGVESLDVGPVTYQFGARVEQSGIDPQGRNAFSYTPVSASVSALWKLDDSHSLNLAVTRSQRAPQVQELLVNGYHDATRSFERGSASLRMETSYNLDLGYRFRSDWMRADFDLFHNWASDYIFQQRTGEFVDEEGNPCVGACAAVLQTRQADAIFKGFEGKLVFPLMENRYGVVDLTLFGDYTRGQFVDGRDVPRLPPLRYGLQLDHAQGKWSSNVRFTRADAQLHHGEFDTPTAGYLLLNVGTQYQVTAPADVKVLLFAKGNNLLNENIRNSTSYLRNFAPEPGRGAEVGIRISY